MSVRQHDLPSDALLQLYAKREDCYTDCFADAAQTTLPTLIRAFYTTRLFKAERMILRIAGHPSTDAQAHALADGAAHFAVWQVEARTTDQILLADASGRTRSWLMARDGHVWFGSAVTPPEPGAPLGPVFAGLLGFHKLYSRALLASAVRRLRRPPPE